MRLTTRDLYRIAGALEGQRLPDGIGLRAELEYRRPESHEVYAVDRCGVHRVLTLRLEEKRL